MCSYPPDRLQEALAAQRTREEWRLHSNEVVIDTQSVISNLPDAVEAFFVLPNSYGAQRQEVIEAWRAYWRIYQLVGGEGPPLLMLDVDKVNEDAAFGPFTVLRTWW